MDQEDQPEVEFTEDQPEVEYREDEYAEDPSQVAYPEDQYAEEQPEVEYVPPAAAAPRSARPRRRFHPLLAIGVVVVVVVVVGLVVYLYLRATHSTPLPFEAYPHATLVAKQTVNSHSDAVTYTTTDSVQDVLNFYYGLYGQAQHPILPNGNLDESNAQDTGCVKVYTEDKPSEAPGHYFGRCIVEDPFGDLTRTLTIAINHQVNADKTTQTAIQIKRFWGGK
ncbi:MAG TPA: hypothetical protein VMT34_12915 [Aggregatilineales bacterium]|nr:hypothetical protein [Aggregatilineales bacterium]